VVADHLDEVQHVEVAVDLDPDRAAVDHHAELMPLVRRRDRQQDVKVAG
jgi:hypothetical protein